MHTDQRLRETIKLVQQAIAQLGTVDNHPARRAAEEHLAAAIDELENLRSHYDPDLSARTRRTLPELATNVSRLLPSLVDQLVEAQREIEEVEEGLPPLQNFRSTEFESLLSVLGWIRRGTSSVEAEIRLLQERLEKKEKRVN